MKCESALLVCLLAASFLNSEGSNDATGSDGAARRLFATPPLPHLPHHPGPKPAHGHSAGSPHKQPLPHLGPKPHHGPGLAPHKGGPHHHHHPGPKPAHGPGMPPHHGPHHGEHPQGPKPAHPHGGRHLIETAVPPSKGGPHKHGASAPHTGPLPHFGPKPSHGHLSPQTGPHHPMGPKPHHAMGPHPHHHPMGPKPAHGLGPHPHPHHHMGPKPAHGLPPNMPHPGHGHGGRRLLAEDTSLTFTIIAKADDTITPYAGAFDDCVVQESHISDDFKKGPVDILVPVGETSQIMLEAFTGTTYRDAVLNDSLDVSVSPALEEPSQLTFTAKSQTDRATVNIGVYDETNSAAICNLSVRFHAVQPFTA